MGPKGGAGGGSQRGPVRRAVYLGWRFATARLAFQFDFAVLGRHQMRSLDDLRWLRLDVDGQRSVARADGR